jgi:hypothetical protein
MLLSPSITNSSTHRFHDTMGYIETPNRDSTSGTLRTGSDTIKILPNTLYLTFNAPCVDDYVSVSTIFLRRHVLMINHSIVDSSLPTHRYYAMTVARPAVSSSTPHISIPNGF